MTKKKTTHPAEGRAESKVSAKNNNDNPSSPQEKVQSPLLQGKKKVVDDNFFETLIELTRSDKGAPYEPVALAKLGKLRASNRAEFERVRARLKIAGCRVSELDRALNGGDQSHVLIELAQTGARLYRTPQGQCFARVVIDGHEETMFLRGSAFRQWLTQKFHQHTGSAPRSDAMRGALDTLDAQSRAATIAEVHTRVAEKDGNVYLDLCDDEWRVVEVTALGWRIVQQPPLFFRRAPGMTALPVPEQGGSIELLRPFLNVASASDFVLVVSCVLSWFRSSGPFPVLVLTGEHGSAKSSFTRNVRLLSDPNVVGLRSLPRNEQDLFIAASNGHVIAFDNVSDLPNWLSDTLCRLATGGGFATRQLFSDQDEVLIDAIRPIILNGIGEVVSRPDLSDRSLFIHLPLVPVSAGAIIPQ